MSAAELRGRAALIAGGLAMAMGGLLIAASLGVIEFGTPRGRPAVFRDPRHWQLAAFGLTFFCAGAAVALQRRMEMLARFNGMVLLLSLFIGLWGSVWYARGGSRQQKGGSMDGFLDSIAAWFRSFGVHPVLGAFVAGALIAFVFAYRRSPKNVADAARPALTSPGRGMVETTATVVSSGPNDIDLNGRRIEVPRSVIEHARAGRTIEAIKELRQSSGLDLKDSKHVIDRLSRSLQRGGDNGP